MNNLKLINHTLDIYKQILDHLQEHINSGEFDDLDIKQSKMLIKEINNLHHLSGGVFGEKNDINMWSNPQTAQKRAYEYLGKDADLYQSNKKDKKYMVFDGKKWVHFGQMGYQDFTKHQDNERRNRYLKRTENMKGNWKKNPYSPNNLSRNILW
jgi:poly-beta-hydroxyalkanoate depolymerase